MRVRFSGGRSDRVVPLCPGWPPGFRPEGFLLGRAATFGGSLEGGLDELREFVPSLASSAAMPTG